MRFLHSFLFFLLIAFCQLNPIKAHCSQCIPCKKTYVDTKQLFIMNQDIWIHVDDLWIPVKAIHTDEQGLYFDTIRFTDESRYAWQCQVCGKYNEGYLENCKKCGNPKDN